MIIRPLTIAWQMAPGFRSGRHKTIAIPESIDLGYQIGDVFWVRQDFMKDREGNVCYRDRAEGQWLQAVFMGQMESPFSLEVISIEKVARAYGWEMILGVQPYYVREE